MAAVMVIHPIQTGSVAIKTNQRQSKGSGMRRILNTLTDRTWTERLPIHAWLIEHDEGLIVVDTGETALASTPGYYPGWHPYYRFGIRPHIELDDEIGPQIRRLGFETDDVRCVVLTHLHTDHVGGLRHFPGARILVTRREWEVASGLRGRLRGFLNHRWPAWLRPELVEYESHPMGPFERSRVLTAAADVVLVPTPGHTEGHQSVVVRQAGTMFFLAGDAAYTERLMLDGRIDGVARDERAAYQTLERIRTFSRQEPTVFLPAHDPETTARFLRRQTVPS